MMSPRGVKSIGFILLSNLLLGFNFHFLKAVHPAPASPTTHATTMMMISVVLPIPVDLVDDDAAASVAEDVAEEVLVVVEDNVERAEVADAETTTTTVVLAGSVEGKVEEDVEEGTVLEGVMEAVGRGDQTRATGHDHHSHVVDEEDRMVSEDEVDEELTVTDD